MTNKDIDELNFTDYAWEAFYDIVDDKDFRDQDAEKIYSLLNERLKIIPFGDYLKRYIYTKAELSEPYNDIPLKEYQQIIKDAFSDNQTPASFMPTTAKLSALSKNWLTQQTVRRKVVFLLGFGLKMSVDDVNEFLTKALREPEINPKNPFEVICWYCYKNGYSYHKYEQLQAIYEKTPPNSLNMELLYSEQTVNFMSRMHSIHDDAALIVYLSKLKTNDNITKISVTAKGYFDSLYNEARDLIAELYNQEENEKEYEYQKKLANNNRLYDYEKRHKIESFRAEKRKYTREDITESDIEHIICAAIPVDRHGNLTPSKASGLNAQFDGKRFSRQHIGEILSGNSEVNRFDLITLNFFNFSQKLNQYPDAKQRWIQFTDSTSTILNNCFMGKLYIQNPYECFVQMCILSDDPLGTYADVWELSYKDETKENR